jgi:hypothetical protein
VKKLSIAIALCCSFVCSPVYAKTFVGVLWPMFGPLPAIGLVELTAEIRRMPDVEVSTYLHQEWPQLVDDIARQPAGTRTVVIGYSLGANASVFVANKSNYVDLIIALQPSVFSWNPSVTGKVGHMIEVYNPNAWMTFGGMGSKKLEGPNIEYIANNDSHPGAQFNLDFRNLVKSEIAKLTTEGNADVARAKEPALAQPVAMAKADVPLPPARPKPGKPVPVVVADARPSAPAVPPPSHRQKDAAAPLVIAEAQPGVPDAQPSEPAAPPPARKGNSAAFVDALSKSVNSGSLMKKNLTPADMRDYVQRTYHAQTAENTVGN